MLISMSIATGRRSEILKLSDMKTQYNSPDIVPGTKYSLIVNNHLKCLAMKNNSFLKNGGQNKSTMIYDTITATMIDLLESLKTNPSHWERPWIKTENGIGAHNAQSKRTYSGLNQIILSHLCLAKGYEFNRWLTFNQVIELGGRVREGAKATPIVFFKHIKTQNETDTSDQKEVVWEDKTKAKFFLTYYNVFNVADTYGLEEAFYVPETPPEIYEIEKIKEAEQIIESCGAIIKFMQQDEAFYIAEQDMIFMPLQIQFLTTSDFYHVLFHEIGHWSGHPQRLNRKLFNLFGSEDYAKEELTAEMCSVFLTFYCKIEIKLKNSAAYIDNWLQVLRKDKRAFILSIMQAQKATNYILKQSGMEHLKHQLQEETEIL